MSTQSRGPREEGSDSVRRRHRAIFLLVAVGLLVVSVAWVEPIFAGYHFGCHEGDHWRTYRLGVEMCK